MKNKQLPLRGLRPLDSGGIYLLAQISLYMIQSFIIIILGFFRNAGVDIDNSKTVTYIMLLCNQVIFAVTPLIYSRFNGINYMREINIKRGISPLQGGMIVIISLLCIVAFMPLSSLFILLVTKLGYAYEMSVPSYVDNFGIFLVSMIFVAVLPAIGEEILYRGFVARGMRKFGVLGAMILSSLLFATAHGNLMQLVYQFFIGLVLFTVYFATRSIIASALLHFLNNGIALLINLILFKTTGSVDFNIPLEGAALVFAMLGISLLGSVLLCVVIWRFLVIAKKRQDKYVDGREVNIRASLAIRYPKKNKGIITRYTDYLTYLNYSFEDEELEREAVKREEELYMNVRGEEEMKYAKESLASRREKDRRWDRNLVILAFVFNIFVLVINIISGFSN